MGRLRYIALLILALAALSAGHTASAAAPSLTFTTVSATDWKASNDFVSFDFNPTNNSIKTLSVTFNGVTTLIVDPKKPYASGSTLQLYHLYGGTGTGGALSGASYNLVPGKYVDMWVVKPAAPGNPMAIETHWVLQAGDPGIHFYAVVRHAAADPTGSFGAATFNLKARADLFQWEYLADTGPRNRGPFLYHFPTDQFQHDAGSPTYLYGAGRQVQAETIDYNGLQNNPNYPLGRQFITKYDYSTYEQYHVAHGMFNDTLGVWMVVPRQETNIAGPTKQVLEATAPVLQMEYESAHLGGTDYVPPPGVDSARLFGPFYLRFNAYDSGKKTPDDLYADATASVAACRSFYDTETTLQSNGYVPTTGRGTVIANIANSQGWSAKPDDNVIVLDDPATDFQQANVGFQYWDYVHPNVNPATGVVTLPEVAPGTYRLSAYVLGQWGEGRADNVTVQAGNVTTLSKITYTPENFSTAAPIWTIGTPDRSAHEFLRGHDAQGHDDREYFGFYNYWQDLAANGGKVVYYATDVPGHAATNDLDQWEAFHWKNFNPGLYPGVYNSSDTTTDGYKYIAPAYVGDPTTYNGAPWEVHFTTTAAQQAQGKYVVLSMGWAAQQASIIVNLNGHQLIARPPLGSDPMVRSGVAGWYSWSALQWDASALNPPGQDNVITIDVSQPRGVLHDALRMEITNTSADPAVTGWHDYEYLYNRTDTAPDPTMSDVTFTQTITSTAPPNPAPTITGLSPSSVVAGSASFPLTITGTGFSMATTVQFGSDTLTPTVGSAGSLVVTVPAADVASAGSRTVTVTNPAPGGGAATATFTVNNPAPIITSLSPVSTLVGSASFPLTITGTGFSAVTTVQFGTDTLTPTAKTPTTLLVTVPASDVALAGSPLVSVTNPVPGGGTATAAFTVNNPAPTIISLSRNSVLAGSPAIPLTITGTGFISGVTTVQFGSDTLTPISVTPTTLTLTIPASDLAASGFPTVTVANPVPGGGTATAPFTVTAITPGSTPAPTPTPTPTDNPVPTLTSLSPASAMAGAPALTLTVTGSGFVPGATIDWNGTALPTTFISATQATATITADRLHVPALVTVTVTNPVPGGGASTGLPFTVTPVTLPTTTAALSGPQDPNGVYTGPVTVTLTAAPGSFPVAATSYTVDNGKAHPYAGPFTLATDGPHTIVYSSTDTAGNAETAKSLSVTLRVILHTFPAGLQMFSVPADYSRLTWAQALSTGAPTLAVWLPSLANYVLTPTAPADALRPGAGYWVRFRQAANLYGPGVPTPTGAPFPISLQRGWNMLGDPFPKSINLSAIGVQSAGQTFAGLSAAHDAGLLDGTLYSYSSDASLYQATGLSGALQPYMGYWLFASAPCTLLVPPP